MASSKSVVIAALIANGAIAILKFFGFVLTGSPAMLSETYHSISDTGNQVFLLVGIRYGARDPDSRHPFGYGKAQFFYSFLVSVLLFGIAGWESAKHGYHKIKVALGEGASHGGAHSAELLGYTFPSVYVNYAVLVGAIVFETYALLKARKAMKLQMEEHDWSGYKEAFRKTSDVTTLTALTEDSIALGGAGLALFGIFLTNYTGNPIYDATAALLIGLMLMGFALALAWENKRLLLGESVTAEEEGDLRDAVADVEGVGDIVDFRAIHFGPHRIVAGVDIAFDDGQNTREIDAVIDEIERRVKSVNPDVKNVYVEVEQDGEIDETPDQPEDGH